VQREQKLKNETIGGGWNNKFNVQPQTKKRIQNSIMQVNNDRLILRYCKSQEVNKKR
jgi:hypothetical protein